MTSLLAAAHLTHNRFLKLFMQHYDSTCVPEIMIAKRIFLGEWTRTAEEKIIIERKLAKGPEIIIHFSQCFWRDSTATPQEISFRRTVSKMQAEQAPKFVISWQHDMVVREIYTDRSILQESVWPFELKDQIKRNRIYQYEHLVGPTYHFIAAHVRQLVPIQGQKAISEAADRLVKQFSSLITQPADRVVFMGFAIDDQYGVPFGKIKRFLSSLHRKVQESWFTKQIEYFDLFTTVDGTSVYKTVWPTTKVNFRVEIREYVQGHTLGRLPELVDHILTYKTDSSTS